MKANSMIQGNKMSAQIEIDNQRTYPEEGQMPLPREVICPNCNIKLRLVPPRHGEPVVQVMTKLNCPLCGSFVIEVSTGGWNLMAPELTEPPEPPAEHKKMHVVNVLGYGILFAILGCVIMHLSVDKEGK